MSTSALVTSISSFPYGTTVYLKRGDTFDMSLTISKGINIDAYGSGANPIIRGSTDIGSQTWTLDAGNVYYTSFASEPKAVFLNNAQQRLAQTTDIAITARTATNKVSASSTTLDALNSTESLVGAYIVAREYVFRPTFQQTITAYSSGVLTCDADLGTSVNAPATGLDFRLLNKKSFISAAGDWSYDASTSRLYYRTSGGSPAGSNLRVATSDYGINVLPGAQNVSIKNIEFTEQGLEAIYSVTNDNITVQNCTAHEIRGNGFSFRGFSRNVNISNNTVYNVNLNGFQLGGIQGIVTGNYVHDIGLFGHGISVPYYRDLFRSVGVGINCRWDVLSNPAVATNLEISSNTITNTAYIGIAFVGESVTIQYNVISLWNQVWDDGGGIYCSMRPYGYNSRTQNCTIYKNFVSSGTTSTASEGIYIDNGATAITVDSNTIESVSDYGILVNYDVGPCTITNNTIVDAAVACIGFRENRVIIYDTHYWFTTYPISKTNICTGNIMAMRATTGMCVKVVSYDGLTSYNPFSSSGNSNNNFYIQPYATNVCRFEAPAGTALTYTLSGWQTKMGLDGSSIAKTNYITFSNSSNAIQEVKLYKNMTGSPVVQSIPAGYTDVNSIVQTSATIPAYSSFLALKQTSYP